MFSLLRNSYFVVSERFYFQEAFLFKGFRDGNCLAQIEFHSAVLAYQECDWGTAISHLERIQVGIAF